MGTKLASFIGLIVVLVAFVAANIVSSKALRGMQADMTQAKLYTLSEGARNIAKNLPEPITMTLYFSEKAGNGAAFLKPYAERVKDVLREFESSSGGKVRVKIENPEPFSEAEDRAVAAGLYGAPLGEDRLYFGLVAVNSTDKQETIPFLDPSREEFLEYDLSRTITLLSDSKKKVVGVLSWLPLDGKDAMAMFNQRPNPPWQVYAQLKDFFEVRDIAKDATSIPDDVSVLLVVHPKQMAAKTQYAVDQFVMRGGRVIVFVDPLCEVDVIQGMDRMQQMQMPKNSELPTLLSAWGLEMVPGKVAGDRTFAIQVQAGSQTRPEAIDFVVWLGLQKEGRSSNDPVSGQLERVNVASAGVIRAVAGATTTMTPLLMTSAQSMEIPADSVSMMPDPKSLLAGFKDGGVPLTIGARVTGPAKSAFPDGPPKGADGSVDANQPADKQLKDSKEPINVIVVADADLLNDRMWIVPQRLGNVTLGYQKIADNGDLVFGAIDNLAGSKDMMSLRARGRFARPFTRIQQLEKDAQQRYQAKQQELQRELQQAQQEIAQLQQTRADGQSSMVLTPEAQAKLDEATKKMVDTRKQLREVQHQLAKDKEALGASVRLLNVAGMPLVVGIGALGLAAYRASRRKSDRASSGARN